MAETFAVFTTPIAGPNGLFYIARACGNKSLDGLWQGWVEFTPVGGGPPIRSPRETTQPNRVDTEYWATGLTPVYLEGSLQRALSEPPPVRTVRGERPAFDEPMGTGGRHAVRGSRESVLDPFSVYDKGEQLLRRQLGALSAWHLVNIVLAYDLSDEPLESLSRQPASYLVELIVSTVRNRQNVAER